MLQIAILHSVSICYSHASLLFEAIFVQERWVHTFFSHVPMYTCKSYDSIQPLQLPHNQCPMRPWTRIRHIQMIPPGLRGELRARLVLDPVPKDRRLSLKFA